MGSALTRINSYQRAFIDFFEDRLVMHGYDWRDLVNDYLLGGKEPLINNLIAGRESKAQS